MFASASNVLDVGCGRGELLDAAARHGVSVRGVDISPAMVEICRGRGFDVELGDALGFVAKQPDSSVGGLVAIQVVEHFDARLSDEVPGGGLSRAEAGRADRARNDQPELLDGLLRNLHPRPHAPAAAASGDVAPLVQASGFSNVDVHFDRPSRKTIGWHASSCRPSFSPRVSRRSWMPSTITRTS